MSEKEYDNKNRGALWSNKENMRKGKKDPSWTGSFNVEGVEYWINVWPVSSETPKAPVMSFSIKKKEPKEAGATEPQGGSFEKELDDEIPF